MTMSEAQERIDNQHDEEFYFYMVSGVCPECKNDVDGYRDIRKPHEPTYIECKVCRFSGYLKAEF